MGIGQEPSLHLSRDTWWDYLLHTYNIHRPGSVLLDRYQAALEVSQDVRAFFRIATLWLHFVNVPLFFDRFFHTEHRAALQPALVLSIVAYTKLLQSNQDTMVDQRSLDERNRAWKESVMLRDLAQGSFEASYNAGWIDIPLAQAAYILAFYEMSAHQDSTLARRTSALLLLDGIIRALGLTYIDAMDPRAPAFTADAVPALGRPDPTARFDSCRSQMDNDSRGFKTSPLAGCPCQRLSLGSSPEARRCTPIWLDMPRWQRDSSFGEIKKEEGRRIVWSSVVMMGVDAGIRLESGDRQLDLHTSKPENFAVLFPGENEYSTILEVAMVYSGKE
ncbi:hypothetical protein FRB97_003307 [Tulasnella sp. 331]|nr:hypothetical protein FRB97_003307 [Tulasnella sp. 331]